MIKLLLVISSYEIGGVSSVAKNLLDSLDRNKFKIIFLAEKIQQKHYPIPDDVSVIDLDIKPGRTLSRKIINLARHIYNLRKKAASQSPDLVFSLSYNTSCFLLFKPIKNLKDRVVVGEYSENFFVKQINPGVRQVISRWVYKLLIFFLYSRAAGIVAVSKSIGRHLEKLFWVKKKIIRVIPTPVNIADIKKRSEEPVSDYVFSKDFFYISLLSRLSPEKGVNYLLNAFARLRQDMRSKLIIIGEGSSMPCLISLARELNIDNDVIFMGYKNNPFKYLKNTDVFVLPSLYEGFPNVILESYVCGVPVIATRCAGGVEEIISDGKNGILVKPADSDSLYNAMRLLALNNVMRQQVKEAGAEKVNEFDISLMLREYEGLFLNTVSKNIN